MTKEQTERLQKVKDRITELQNRCNRAQQYAILADDAQSDETAEALIVEAELSLGTNS